MDGHRVTPRSWASLAKGAGEALGTGKEKKRSQRALIVPCLACYHHFAAGKPERTAAAAPQRILGSVGAALSGI